MAGAGFEDLTVSANNRRFSPSRAAIGAAVSTGGDRNPAERLIDPGDELPSSMADSPEQSALLALLAAAWNRLTDADRAAVVTLAERLASP